MIGFLPLCCDTAFVLSGVALAQGVMAGAVTVLGNFTGQVGKKRQVRSERRPSLHWCVFLFDAFLAGTRAVSNRFPCAGLVYVFVVSHM
jgi:hypothetical protein